MIPGMNSRKAAQMMKKMGIAQQELDAVRVVVTLHDKELVFEAPSLSKVNMMGQQTFQLVGTYTERSLDSTPDINDDDIETVKSQTGKEEEEIRAALEKNDGDIAQTILQLSSES